MPRFFTCAAAFGIALILSAANLRADDGPSFPGFDNESLTGSEPVVEKKPVKTTSRPAPKEPSVVKDEPAAPREPIAESPRGGAKDRGPTRKESAPSNVAAPDRRPQNLASEPGDAGRKQASGRRGRAEMPSAPGDIDPNPPARASNEPTRDPRAMAGRQPQADPRANPRGMNQGQANMNRNGQNPRDPRNAPPGQNVDRRQQQNRPGTGAPRGLTIPNSTAKKKPPQQNGPRVGQGQSGAGQRQQ